MSDVFSAQTRLAIAIDFGTANCSASWTYYRPESSACLLKDDFDIKGIHNVFFHGQTDRYMKTEFAWSQSLQKWILGNRIDSQIGKRNLREEDRITHVKLALDPCKHTEKIRNRIQDQVDALPAEAGIMSIDALVVKFLSLFYAEITTKLADHISLDKLQVETVIAIPAAWDLSLAHKMKMLAEKAGFRNVRPPVYEPDAAALYSRFDRSRLFDHAPASLADCEASFIIVDVGGGTANVVTYTIEDRSLVQSCPSDGGLHGSCLLNSRFYDVFEETVGHKMKDIIEEWTKKEIRRLSHKKAPPKEEYRVLERRIKAKLRVYVEQQFELAKESIDKDFEGEGVFQIEMLGIDTYDPDFGLCCPYFEISREAIRERVFSPMITPILELIQAQVSEFDSVQGKLGLKLRNLFFVGGASSNGYIRKRIQDHFKSLTMLPRHDNSATLVADGSLIRYLRRDAIKTTSVSRSFGVVWDEEYEKDTHGSDVKLHRDKFDQKYVVRDCITWIFRRVFEINFYLDRRLSLQGEHIPSGEERFMPKGAWHAVPITGLQRLRQNLYQSKTQTKDHVPLSSPKSGIRQIGYVEIVLSTKDRKDFQVISRGKKKWHLFDYTMRMKYDHSVMEYEFIIPKNGCGECNENWEESNGAKVMAARLEPDICFDWQEQESASTQPPSGCASDQVANRPPTNNSATANYIYNDISGRRDQPQIDVNQSTNLKRKQKHMKDLTHKRTRHSDLNHHGADHTPYSSPLPKKAPSKRLITPDIHPHERSPASRARGNPRKAIQTSAPMAIMSELHNNKRRRGTSIYDFEDSSEYWSDENAETGPNQPPVDVWSFWPENA